MNTNTDPIVAGRYYTLKVKRFTGRFYLLDGGDVTIPLHASESPDDLKPGMETEVFVFMDGKDGLKATTRKPHACLGDFAAMEVVSTAPFGVFLDWGIKKDLFVPIKLLRTELETGDTAVVQLIPDYDGVGVIGTTKFEDFFETDLSALSENQKVECLVFGFNDMGIRVILDNRYKGLLYRNEVFEELKVGDKRTGYIKKIRPDGLIDAALNRQGFRESTEDARSVLLKALEEAGGFLPLYDKSTPEEIKDALKMSKKIFKKTVGGLYREKIIEMEEKGIRLIKNS